MKQFAARLVCIAVAAQIAGLVPMVPGASAAGAPWSPPDGEAWRYQLLHESGYVDDCPPCAARPTLEWPLRGSFQLTPGDSNPLFQRYALTGVRLTVGGGPPGGILLEGSGTLEVGGEVALIHRLTLRLAVQTDTGREIVDFDSGPQPGEPQWPWLDLKVSEVDPRLTRVLSLHFDAMPIRDLWFSTRNGFTASLPGPDPVRVSGGELVSDQGRVVVTLDDIRSALQLTEPTDLMNLDAADVTTGGVVEFSLGADAVSGTLGTVHHGDLVSLAGQRVAGYPEFGAAIAPEPPTPDLGLDAVQQRSDGTRLFSTQEAVFSERLGTVVGRGDLMSSTGKLHATNRELLKAFHPLNPDQDYGLDAVFVWPTGEVWFSTEDSVALEGGRFLLDGDLLSSTGRILYGNLELLQQFSPLEDTFNFGLDALVIATDATDPVPEPPVARLQVDDAQAEARLEWTGKGRFFQVEGAAAVSGPYAPVTPVVAGSGYTIPISGTTAYFRVRQW